MVKAGVSILALALALTAGSAAAAVVARVDRTDIELNESFTLEIVSDSNIDMQPDITALQEEFYVGQSSQLSNTTIVNGQIERSKTWSFVLMPKRAGQLTVPPVTLGNEQSNALTVEVSEPTYAPPGEAEVFVTSEVDLQETYVQAQALLTIKIYRSVPTRQPALREPEFSGVDYLVELAGDDRSYEAIIDGTPYNVVERVYAIYPQEHGELQISPARFEARVLRAGRITGRKVYESEPQTISVLSIPAPPADFPDADWLPARELELSEEWSRNTDEITAGEPVTRHVVVSALGLLETQIPVLEPPSAPGLNVYPDKPELTRGIESRGIRGVRKDQYAIIGTVAGSVVLPALEVPWWNIDAGEWRVARLPERRISILPSSVTPAPQPQATAVNSENEAEAPASEPVLLAEGFWRRVSELLAAVWLATLGFWWWTSRPPKRVREPEPLPIHRQQARHLKAARKAAVSGDDAAVRKAMLDWGMLQWPGDAPRSIGALAARVSAPLADELRRMADAAYGPRGEGWDGEALARALRSFGVVEDAAGDSRDLLPPLMPR